MASQAPPVHALVGDGQLLVVFNKMMDQKMKEQVPGIVADSQKRSM
jgi:hypothetical protein